MAEQQGSYVVGASEQEESINNARAMMGWDGPAVEIEAPRTVSERRGDKWVEADRPAFVKIYTNFKSEMKDIDPDALKVWLFIALSVNRYSGEAHPGLRAISDGVGMAVNTVRAAVERLETVYHLLEVEKEGGRSNKYYPVDYVSATREGVSRGDTVPQTVSISGGTVSKTAGTVSTQYRKSAQPEEPELNKSESALVFDFEILTIEQAKRVPTLKLYWRAADYWPGSKTWAYIHKTITENNLTEEKISAAATEWGLRGYRPENVKGILEWAVNGIPAGKNGAPAQTDQKPAVDEVRVQQTQEMLAQKLSGNFVPRPAHIERPRIGRAE